MDWKLAIERNRQPLLRIVAALFFVAGLAPGARGPFPASRLKWVRYRLVLGVLRPAEAAVRRLIVIAALGLEAKTASLRNAAVVQARRRLPPRKAGSRISFRFCDPRKRFAIRRRSRTSLVEPRLQFIEIAADPRVPLFRQPDAGDAPATKAPAIATEKTVNALPLFRRLAAIKLALDDLGAQAQRYVRWKAKPLDQRRPKLIASLRPGKPPGYRALPMHEVDDILMECHGLAGLLAGMGYERSPPPM
jgi:hypothetical protein